MRLIDFAAGLIFASHGTIERVEKKVFMLTPTPGAAAVDSAARDGFLEAVDHMREDVTAPDQTGTETHQAGQESASA